MGNLSKIVLKSGRDESLKRYHPWVFSGAVNKVEGEVHEGDVVEVIAADGTICGFGHYQVGSIVVRMLSFSDKNIPEKPSVPLQFWVDKIGSALQMRRELKIMSNKTNAYRLIHGEGDQLPGLIIDYYNGIAVVQAHSAGMYLSLQSITMALEECYGEHLQAVYNKSEGTAPFKAGLDLKNGFLFIKDGAIFSKGQILENGNKFNVNWKLGQKTGFFLDQRDNRALVGSLSKDKRVLNLFCYTGGFSIYALNNSAKSVVSVDSSQLAIDTLNQNIELNFPNGGIDHISVCGDAIDYLKNIKKGEFDLIIVDPPAFAKHKGALNNALRAYKRLNAMAIEKVAKGGFVFTYSCSQVVDKEAFSLAVFSAAAISGRDVKILNRLTQPADHPINIFHP